MSFRSYRIGTHKSFLSNQYNGATIIVCNNNINNQWYNNNNINNQWYNNNNINSQWYNNNTNQRCNNNNNQWYIKIQIQLK